MKRTNLIGFLGDTWLKRKIIPIIWIRYVYFIAYTFLPIFELQASTGENSEINL